MNSHPVSNSHVANTSNLDDILGTSRPETKTLSINSWTLSPITSWLITNTELLWRVILFATATLSLTYGALGKWGGSYPASPRTVEQSTPPLPGYILFSLSWMYMKSGLDSWYVLHRWVANEQLVIVVLPLRPLVARSNHALVVKVRSFNSLFKLFHVNTCYLKDSHCRVVTMALSFRFQNRRLPWRRSQELELSTNDQQRVVLAAWQGA